MAGFWQDHRWILIESRSDSGWITVRFWSDRDRILIDHGQILVESWSDFDWITVEFWPNHSPTGIQSRSCRNPTVIQPKSNRDSISIKIRSEYDRDPIEIEIWPLSYQNRNLVMIWSKSKSDRDPIGIRIRPNHGRILVRSRSDSGWITDGFHRIPTVIRSESKCDRSDLESGQIVVDFRPKFGRRC